MDEVENPDLPAAGESSPTLRPIEDEDGDSGVRLGDGDAVARQRPLGSIEAGSLIDSGNAQPSDYNPVAAAAAAAATPAAPPQSAEPDEFPHDPPDSLTLADLKRIRATFPPTQAPPKQQVLDDEVYDFEYRDAQSLPVEVEEWFGYSEEEASKLRKCRGMFIEAWQATEEGARFDWVKVSEETRRAFVRKVVDALRADQGHSTANLLILTYVGLGIWDETAGRPAGCALESLFSDGPEQGGMRLDEYEGSGLQLQWIIAMVDTLHACDGLPVVYEAMRRSFDSSLAATPVEPVMRNEAPPKRGEESVELWCSLTLMYLFLEVARTTQGVSGQELKSDVLALEPKLLNYLTQAVARLRWDESAPVPLTKMLLLAWKAILVTLGGIRDVEHVKASLRENKDEEETDARGQPVITASPLDYHLFRQEINSKYPAYQPPAPLFPLEPENNTILPPLKHRRSSVAPSETNAPSVVTGGRSIMHQPVHIATPAPSPPPSPAGPGKAGKKQNYQTNQMFPFLYPPLDSSSNELGGKGSTELQDVLVGRRWEGADIPASILEAAELFAKRMRATRAMKQLWEVRVEFMKYERGWKSVATESANEDGDEDEDEDEDFELVPEPTRPDEESAPQGEPMVQTQEEETLDKVGTYYRDALPHLQSLVIVLLKTLLAGVTENVTKTNGGLQAGIQFSEPLSNGANNGSSKPAAGDHANAHLNNGAISQASAEMGFESATAEELDKLRTQEIAAKALSATLLLLVKWFKVSHVLQYEYMTQLLLDSNYVPLVLKLWQTQEIGRACHYRLERAEANFFAFCQRHSRQGGPEKGAKEEVALEEEKEKEVMAVMVANEEEGAESEEDEAAPPPILLRRPSPPADISTAVLSPTAGEFAHPPEIDELGYPQTPLPSSPLKRYSYRNVFSAINHLRVLQKVTRRKTHRALLLVSYKSGNHLRKTLRIPVQGLRYYTLKLYKTQVPFCGRKWRQGNMKIITAVWLSVPAELRDDWLMGGGGGMGGACVGDVDGTVEDALPLEQGLRSLTHWWNVRNFPEAMGVSRGLLEAEADFFERELARLDTFAALDEGEMGEEMMGPGGMEGDGWQGPIEGY